MTNVDVLKEKVKELMEEGTNTFSEMDEFSEWDSLGDLVMNMGKISAFVNKLANAVKVASEESFNQLEALKEEDQVQACAEVMDEMIELPFFLEKFDQKVFALLVGVAIEGINSKYGEEWNLDVARRAVSESVDVVTEITEM